MKNNAKFYRKIIAVTGIALLVAGITRTGWAGDGKDFADKAKFTTIDFPGANGTLVFGINPQGDIVGSYADGSGKAHGFLLRDGTFSTIDPPGTTFTFANGINPRRRHRWVLH